MLPRTSHNRLVSLLLVGALLLCHGAFGALHLVPDPPPPSAAGSHAAAEGHAGVGHAGAGHGEHPEEHPAQHGPDAGYFAVLLVSLLGAAALQLLRYVPRRAGILLAPRNPVGSLPENVLARPRGPTLQVFRL